MPEQQDGLSGHPPTTVEPRSGTTAKVWDLGVRGFHWLLVAAVSLCLYTGFLGPANWLGVHVWTGTFIAALILFRLVWGIAGSTYSRFASFIPTPGRAIRYAIALLQRRAAHVTGHNPLGSVMIVALLVTVTALLGTGVLTLGGMLKQGPLAFALSFASGRTARTIHEWLGFGLLGLVFLHVLGVAIESWRTGENLVAAMLSGRKRIGEERAAAVLPARPWLTTGIVVLVLLVARTAVIALAARPGYGVPQTIVNEDHQRECGSCHFAFPPSLASAGTWHAIMAGLDEHFGAVATLDPAIASRIGAYLADNSAEHWDTLPAHVLRETSAREPLRITGTAYWTRRHHEIPAETFKSTAVGGRTQCNACHGDAASGLFAPQSINIPRQAQP